MDNGRNADTYRNRRLHPQVNGVVRTLTSLARALEGLGATAEFLSPEGFPSFGVPSYPGLRLALPTPRKVAERIERSRPDAIHIATEGTIGLMAGTGACAMPARSPRAYYTVPRIHCGSLAMPERLLYAALRRFHSAATVTIVATPSLIADLSKRGFSRLGIWIRGVDTDLFNPAHAIELDFPRPIFRKGQEPARRGTHLTNSISKPSITYSLNYGRIPLFFRNLH